MIALASAAAVCSVLLWIAAPVPAILARLEGRHPHPGPARGAAPWWWVLAALSVLTVVIALAGGFAVAVVVAVGAPAWTLAWVVRAHRRRRSADRRRQEVVRSCQILAGLLRIGHVPASSLAAAAADAPILGEPAAVRGIGGDVGPVLRRLALRSGQEGLAELANAWEVAERTGASLTATLDALSDRLTADTALRNIVRAELAAPRATGRLLGALPVVGLALGYALGGDPLGYLTGTSIGQVCLVAGVLLGCVGVVWTEQIANREGAGRGLG